MRPIRSGIHLQKIINMHKFRMLLTTIPMVLLFVSCKINNTNKTALGLKTTAPLYEARYNSLVEYPADSLSFPRSMSLKTNKVKKVPSKDWTSGFFVGNLWQLYALTGENRFKAKAEVWNKYMEKEKLNRTTHDMGFKIFCSYGKGILYSKENKEAYEKVIVESANTLITRYNPKVKALRSWDFNADIWEFPVIIDNMINLELLFEASKITGDDTYKKIAINHANSTLQNHFRPDNSTFHVIVYDSISGKPKMKVTHQGYNDASSWARGQSWAVYGFTMAYRFTKDKAYLKQAEATANFFINHKNMPNDGIPYWDFNDPTIPNAPTDASAAAVMSSALLELYQYDLNPAYLNYAKKVLAAFNTPKYVLDSSVKGPFILGHSTGNKPKDDEIDEPIVYADYYFLEALLRLKNL